MDADATLRAILADFSATDYFDKNATAELLRNLADWVQKGGFPPRVAIFQHETGEKFWVV